MDIERRFIPGLELRVTENESGPILEGLGAPFGKWSEDLGGFREQNKKGAFSKTIKESDIRGIHNHNNDWVFGRTGAGTLKLWEDDDGLRYSSTVDDGISYVADMLKSIRRGDITGNSYAFHAEKDEWSDNNEERMVLEARLYEVGPQVFPAYPDTTVGTRAEFPIDEKWSKLNGLIFRIQQGGKLKDSDLEFLERCVGELRTMLPEKEIPEPGPESHSEEPEPEFHSTIDEQELLLRSKSLSVAY